MAITRGQLTVIGPESAVELLFQYSVNGSSNWHTVFAEGDLYFRVSSDGGVSWSEPARFAGPSGVSTYVHLAYANSADGSVGFSTSISTGKTYLGQWVSSSPTPSQEYDDYKWQKFVGEDGKGIVSATVGYQLHTSGTTPPTGTWLKDPPTPVQGRYSWTRTITTYTSGDPVTTYSVAYLATNGQNGADGKGITSTVIEYAQTTSGTTTPSSWSTTRPNPEKGQYLWTKTTISYSDSTNSVSYNISYSATDGQKGDKGDKGDPGIPGNPGADGQSQWTHLRYSVASNGNPMETKPTASTKYIGIAVTNSGTAPTGYSSYTWQKFVGEDGDDGKGISSTVVTYANHTNGTTAPTSGWQETPAPVKGRYLWTRTVTTYTDGSTIPTYSVAYQATDGQAGKGISSTVVEYAQTTSGTTTPTSWSGTRPAPVKGQYLWSKTTITYTDTTTSVSYSTSYSATDGQKGDQGDQGVPGTPGKDGQQYWTWIKYADSPTTGMNDLPAGKDYIGIAHNQTSPTESTDYADYTWSLIKGDKGERGATGERGPRGEDGTSVTGIVEHYLATPLATGVTSATSGWTTTMQPMTTTNRYLWNYETIQFSAGDPQDTIPVVIGVYGDTGRALAGITEYYLASASSTGVTRPATDGTNGWTTTPQVTTPDLPYLWNYEKLTWNAAPTTSYINPIVIAIHGQKGDKGDKGDKGETGSQGKGITTTKITYQVSTSGTAKPSTWQETIPTVADNQFLWTRTTINYSDNTSVHAYSVGKMGAQGPKGDTGDTGTGISSTSVTYQASSSGTVTPTGTWHATVPTVADNQFLWTRVIVNYTDDTSSTSYSIGKMGAQGPQGAKGDPGAKGATGERGPVGPTGVGVESITEYYLATPSGSGVTTDTSGWKPNVQTMTSTNKYLWNYEVVNFTDGSSSPTVPVIIGVYGATGATGRALTGVTEYYLASASASGVSRPATDGTGGWTTTPQITTPELPYLWNYEKLAWSVAPLVTYNNPIVIGIHGEKGDKGDKGDRGEKGATGDRGPIGPTGTSISSVVEYYLATSASSGVTTSTSGWKTTLQPMSATNKYLWNYEVINFSDNSSSPTIPVIIGVYGDKGETGATGRSITGITEHYLASSLATGVTRTTSGWKTTMQTTTPTNKYLWNYETITWSSGTTTTYTDPIIIGIHGEQGPQGLQGIQGPAGANGQSQWTHIRYSIASNGNPFVPAPTATTKYIGIAVTNTSTAPTGYASYTWQKFVGENGGQGIQGPAGANGQPTYTWIRYADSASGAGIVNTPAGKDYIGIAHNKLTATESNNPGDYTWSLIKGEPGRSITSVDVQYAKNSSTTSAPTTGWSTTAPAWENGKYIWSKTVTTYSTGNPTESKPVCITGQKGSTGGTGATGRGVSSIVEQFYLSTSKTTQTGGSWSTTMPTWEPGKYVWTRSFITYTSGTPATSTTEPLVSSEWEAVNEIQVGGRNLVLDSETERVFTNSVFGISLRAETFHDYIGEKLTISFDAKADLAEQRMDTYLRNVSTASVVVDTRLTPFEVSTTWTRYSYTITLPDISDVTNLALAFRNTSAAGGSVTGPVAIKNIQIEKGNIATDWTPAPEDVLPAWVKDWSGTATKIGENYVLSPYIFSGYVDINGLATGVSIGMDLTPGDPKPASSIYGYTSGGLSYQLTGNTFEMIGSSGSGAGLSTADPRAEGVRFWAGATHEDRNTAPFQVLEDGTLKATKAIIEGRITLTDPGASNIVTKETLGSFAYETANLLDEATNDFETIELKENIPYRLSSIRVGEGVYLKSGDEITFASRLKSPLVTGLKCGLAFVSETPGGAETTEHELGTITPYNDSSEEHLAKVTATIPPDTLYVYPFYVFGNINNPTPGVSASLEHKHQMVTRGEELEVWKPSFSSLTSVLDDKTFVMNYADGLFTQSVRSTEYLSDMDALYAVLDNKADVSRILDSDDVRALVGVMQGEDYWGLVGVRSDIDRHNGAVNIVESSMTYKPRAEGSSAMELEFKTQGSENSLAINNEGIYFRSGTENVAWISQSTLHIASATIIDELRIGGHMFAKLSQDPRYTVIRAI